MRLLRTVVAAVVWVWLTLPAWAGVDIQHWTTSQGARVYFVASDALPIVDLEVDFAAGSAFDPAGKVALSDLTRRLLDTGAGELDENEIANRLADVGAQLRGGVDEDRASVSLRTLSSDEERSAALAVLNTVLHQPNFPEDVLAREKKRAVADLQESLTQPGAIATRRFTASIYGAHPYGAVSTEESIRSIARDDVERFYRSHYTVGRASISIIGDVDRAQAEQIAEAIAAGLPHDGESADKIPPVALPDAAQVRVPHPSAQAHVLIGMPGITREDPDYYPLLIGNYVLGGGGFVSRLMKEVREKRGFAYSVYSHFSPHKEAGPFQIGLQTKGSQVSEALDVVNKTVREFIAEGPTEEELAAARDYTINGFGLRLDSNRKVLSYVSMIGFYELPLDWLDQYPLKVAALTVAEVRDAFRRRVLPEHMVSVVVGGDGDSAQVAGQPAAMQ
ncbi:MAG: insulinase family protein [Rhodocyclaceae bacterium]|nr:insulinase family protein [Rhodocyclaceae bacterium]